MKSHEYLKTLNSWSEDHKMELNLDKTKKIIFNFTKDKKFTINMTSEGKEIEVVNQTKLLGTVISLDLKWDSNVHSIIIKANARMEILRKLSEYKSKKEDMKLIYFSSIRSVLEQSCQVWYSGLTEENANDLERIQKNAMKIIFGENYIDYEKSLIKLNLQESNTRRIILNEKFARKCLENTKTAKMFPDG